MTRSPHLDSNASKSTMGFYYRRSVNFGAFRVNLSSRGIGYSVGGRGFRVGRGASGRGYTTFSIPGTGIGYRRQGCGLLVAALAALGLASALTELLA